MKPRKPKMAAKVVLSVVRSMTLPPATKPRPERTGE